MNKKALLFTASLALLAACQGNQGAEKNSSPTEEKNKVSTVLGAEQQQALTPDAVLEGLKAGNARFVENKLLDRQHTQQAEQSLAGQYPEAIVLSCIDSRVPVEYIFDKGIGDLFVARVAGNVADKYMLGSMEYACEVAGSKLVLVLGHQDCGAVKAAIKGFEMGNITALVEDIKPSVDATKYEGERKYSDKGFFDAVVAENVVQTMDEIRQGSPILKKLEEEGKIKIVGAVYDIGTGAVHFL